MYADMQLTITDLPKGKCNIFATIYNETGESLAKKTWHDVTMLQGMYQSRAWYLAVTARTAAANAHAAGLTGPEGQLEMFPEHPDWE